MCGAVAYVGDKPCRQYLLEGLRRLEYRGYDSAGIVCIDSNHNHFSYQKEAGGLDLMQKLAQNCNFDGLTGMGHTRWATHGVVNQNNAHPHFNCRKNIAVIHNGIIEGYEQIREQLIQEGHDFYSTTDTEVAAHLLGTLLDTHKSVKSASLALAKKLHGAFAFIFMIEELPDQLLVLRRRSPLVIGIGNNEMFLASDVLAFGDRTNKVIFLPDESCAIIKKNSFDLYNFAGEPLFVTPQEINLENAQFDKQGFEHFMIKEIYEQKRAILRTVSFYNLLSSCGESYSEKNPESLQTLSNPLEYNDCIWRQVGVTKEQISDLKKINLVAAGTSWHAARIAQFFFEMIAKIPTHVYLASEFRYMPFFAEEETLFIMVSQSGETADTLEALRLVSSFEIPTIAITNVASSTMVREASGFLPMQAGPEISVAATKTFSSQLASLYWLANRIALTREIISPLQMHEAEEDLYVAAEMLESTLETYKLKIINELAPRYAKFDRFIFLGRHVSYPFALEAALKLKEISYIFAQCYPAGELKHGPIALIDEKTPVFIFSVLDELIYHKLVSNAHEVKARKGNLIVFAFEGQKELIDLADISFILPKGQPLLSPLVMTGLMQFLVYQISKELGLSPDKPRNLAKSVTVE